MRGTAVCPHCNTRFKVTKTQLEAHHGMVRCGHCMQAFDTGPNFAPDQLDLQLELPVLNKLAKSRPSAVEVLKPMTLAEQVEIVEDEVVGEPLPKPLRWPWAVAVLVLVLLMTGQAAFFFRVDLAAQLPSIKPALLNYCRMLDCSVPLPQHADLISIESSDLEADPDHPGQITFNALLRNRAAYAQAFPNLELTLNDSLDAPLARRVFRPADYLPPAENEAGGMLADHEMNIKLHLDTGNLYPIGYRLVLFYPDN